MINLLHGDLAMFDKDECKDSQTSHYSIKIIYCQKKLFTVLP